MRLPTPANLTAREARDLVAIVDRSAGLFGEDQAERLEARIVSKCREIAEGLNHGHARRDVSRRRLTRFLVVHPIVVAYSPDTRRVLRILDGRRDFTRLFR